MPRPAAPAPRRSEPAETDTALNPPHEALHEVVDLAARSIADVDHMSVSLARHDGPLETIASSGSLAAELDLLQSELREGPYLYAAEAQSVVRIDRIALDPRWPRYNEAAARRGVRSQLSLQLYLEARSLGTLCLLSTSTDSISAESEDLAELFASFTALTWGHVRREGQLREALGSRQVIGQATGIIMERHRLSERRAFEYLVRVSSHSNIKLRDVSAEVVTLTSTSNEPH